MGRSIAKVGEGGDMHILMSLGGFFFVVGGGGMQRGFKDEGGGFFLERVGGDVRGKRV